MTTTLPNREGVSEIGTDCFVPFVRDVEEGRREERKRKEGRQAGRSGGQFVCVCVRVRVRAQ